MTAVSTQSRNTPFALAPPLITQTPMHIVYFLPNALNRRDFERFGMGFFLERGDRITVLDIAPLIHPSLTFDRQAPLPDPRIVLRVLSNTRQVADQESTVRDADLVIFVAQSYGVDSRNISALRLLCRCRRPYLIFSMGVVPRASGPDRKPGLIDRLRGMGGRLEFCTSLDRAIRRLPLWMLGIAPANFVVHDGRASVRPNPLVTSKTVRIFAHSFDYERTRQLRDGTQETNSAVFLDQFIPYHQDLIVLGLSDRINPARYHAALRRLFDQVERELGLRVVIAAHPRANYPDPSVFGGREIFYGKSPELIRDSSLVITHSSTAASYAAIFQKQALIVATQEMLNLNHAYAAHIHGTAQSLGTFTRIICPDSDTNLAGALECNEILRGMFMENFVKTASSPDAPLWQIVANALTQNGELKHQAINLNQI